MLVQSQLQRPKKGQTGGKRWAAGKNFMEKFSHESMGVWHVLGHEGLSTYLSQHDHLTAAMQGITHSVTVALQKITTTVLQLLVKFAFSNSR